MLDTRRKLIIWTLICAGAELAGIAVAAGVFGLVATLAGEPVGLGAKLVAWFASSLSGVPEGFVLGTLQAIGIARIFAIPLDSRTFVMRTMIVAVAGWAVGSAIPLFFPFEAAPGDASGDPPLALLVAGAALFGALAGALFGFMQRAAFTGTRLRTHWLLANTAGWAIGLPAIYMAAQWGSGIDSIAARIAVWAAGGCTAGAVIGLATGLALIAAYRRGADRPPVLV